MLTYMLNLAVNADNRELKRHYTNNTSVLQPAELVPNWLHKGRHGQVRLESLVVTDLQVTRS